MKSNIKLTNIKSNKEYSAALKEIEDLNVSMSNLEDRTIQTMELIEELEATCAKNKELQINAKEAFDKDKEEIEKSLHDFDVAMKDLMEQREDLYRKADHEILKKYKMLLEKKGGTAVSPVIQGICQTCHMGIPPQKFNELIKSQILMTCPFCYRIIYWGEDEHYQIKH